MNSIASSSSKKGDEPSTSDELLSLPSTSSGISKPVARVSPRNELNEEKRADNNEGDDATSSTTHHPDEFLNDQWEVDMIQYFNFNPVTSRLNDSLSISTIDPKRMKSGAAYRAVCDKDTSEYKCFRDENKQLYRVGDFVYMEIDPAYPYVIGKVESFKMKKGTQMTVKVTRLYRREDLIADSLALLEAERIEAGVVENNDEVKIRELFPSDAHLSQSVAVLRGKCHIVHLSIKNALQDTKGIFDNDVFFYCTSYYPDTGRLSACHPEIREGEKFQAVCPPLADSGIATEADRDQLVYKPGNMCAEVEETVVKFARTFRTAALLENPQINELERTAFQGDRVKIDALDCLTRCGYVSADAVKEMMNADKIFLEHAQFLSSDDTKKFVKGLRNYGKNFPKIVKEYLPSFSRDSLVHYYYWWKKSNDAFKPKKVNGTTIKKPLFPQTKRSRAGNSEQAFVDYDSASEDEEFEYGRACHHCYTMDSKDWHHSGMLNLLLCTDCRQHYKRYGTMREVERPKDIPRSLIHEEVLNGTDDGEEGVRTRASNRRDRLKTPNDDDRTPSKNGIDVDGERRSTPQRSVKIQKRTYHPSTSSTDDPITPKKAKELKSNKLKPIHQLALTNKLKTEKQESVDSDDQINACTKNASTSASDNTSDKSKRHKDEELKIEEDEVDIIDNSPVEVKDKHNLKVHSECALIRLKNVENEDPSEYACSRTQLMFRCDDEAKWIEKRKQQADLRQKQRRETQAAKSQSELDKQRAIEQEQQQIQRQIQQAAAQQAVMPMAMSRPPPDLLHQMRMPGMPSNPMLRNPAMSAFPPELMALAATRPELLQALALQQPRPPMMMQPFGTSAGLLNPAALMQNPSNALMFQMQSAAQAQQNQARLLEEQKRQQQEQRERQQRDHLQQMQNQQILMAMGLNPQMLGPGFPLNANLAGLPTSMSIPTSQQLSLQSNMPQSAQQLSQFDQLAQMFRSASTAALRQQQENQHNHDMMQLILSRLQQDQQRGQQPK